MKRKKSSKRIQSPFAAHIADIWWLLCWFVSVVTDVKLRKSRYDNGDFKSVKSCACGSCFCCYSSSLSVSIPCCGIFIYERQVHQAYESYLRLLWNSFNECHIMVSIPFSVCLKWVLFFCSAGARNTALLTNRTKHTYKTFLISYEWSFPVHLCAA